MRKLGKFKVLKYKKAYKNLDKYLDSIYRANKDLINDNIITDEELKLASNKDILKRQSKKKLFKEAVKEYMDEGYRVDEALKKLSNSRVFTEYVETAQENTLDALREYKDAWRRFRELTKEKGRYTKIDPNRLVYIGNNEYSYGDVIISFRNSPKEVIVRKA